MIMAFTWKCAFILQTIVTLQIEPIFTELLGKFVHNYYLLIGLPRAMLKA